MEAEADKTMLLSRCPVMEDRCGDRSTVRVALMEAGCPNQERTSSMESLAIRAFRPVDRIAAGLLVPYAVWVAFASVLNFMICRMN